MSDETSHEYSIAVYPGTFDPITMGHVDIIKRALKLFDKVIVAVAVNSAKDPVFTLKERIMMIEETFKGEKRICVESVSGLLVDGTNWVSGYWPFWSEYMLWVRCPTAGVAARFYCA